MGMDNIQEECLFCNDKNIVNNNYSSIDAFEFYCKNCTGKYYLIFSNSELKFFKELIPIYKEKILEIFNEDNIRPDNEKTPFDYHWPLTFKDITKELGISSY